jgi:hypothetical protein
MLAMTVAPVAAQVLVPRDSAQAITNWAAGIERKPTDLTTTDLDLPSSSSEESQVALFRSGDSVRKAAVIYHGESGSMTDPLWLSISLPHTVYEQPY